MLEAATEAVLAGAGVADLARSLHVSEDVLLRWCRHSGLPVPRRLLLWLRVLLAAERLENPGLTVEEAARGVGYHSAREFRRALRNVADIAPAELRERGAFLVLSGAFARALHANTNPRGEHG